MIVKANQTLMDIAIEELGGIEGFATLLFDNPSLTIDGALTAGMNIVVDLTKVVVPAASSKKSSAVVLKTIAEPNQNVLDLAIQYLGTVEGVAQLLTNNPQLAIDELPLKGSSIYVDNSDSVVNKPILNFIKGNNIIIATAGGLYSPANELVNDDGGALVNDDGGILVND